jgi:hypothetical protein
VKVINEDELFELIRTGKVSRSLVLFCPVMCLMHVFFDVMYIALGLSCDVSMYFMRESTAPAALGLSCVVFDVRSSLSAEYILIGSTLPSKRRGSHPSSSWRSKGRRSELRRFVRTCCLSLTLSRRKHLSDPSQLRSTCRACASFSCALACLFPGRQGAARGGGGVHSSCAFFGCRQVIYCTESTGRHG